MHRVRSHTINGPFALTSIQRTTRFVRADGIPEEDMSDIQVFSDKSIVPGFYPLTVPPKEIDKKFKPVSYFSKKLSTFQIGEKIRNTYIQLPVREIPAVLNEV